MSIAFLILGAVIFAAGVMFERFDLSSLNYGNGRKYENIPQNINLTKQWENLLGYDGTAKEEENDSE